ncbi:hypothetical protein [Nostoc favosum]|uniref:Transcription factor zinc-finger domain-containing protein n=1 Tax=Nostoc favosum CHAB5714 TaxID=2780399 RepID=A0ABS8IGQ3_9NOSO|nr:hypothetical protein [Nostoc favosum]MCC5602939.1 hypothetical protein [Nostoc favosum CHAB5714]
MTNKTCPRCDCTRLQYQENYGYWECLDCGHIWALDANDPDYDEMELCSKCHGKGVLAYGGVNYSCTLCGGSGLI